MTDDELVALGLCDADKLHTSRPAFIRMLLEQGATVEEVQDAAKHGQARLWSLSVALQLYAPGRVGLAEASERTGASIDEIREWWHDYGWPDPALPDTTFNEWDLQLLEIMTDRIPLGILPRPVVSDFLRTATTAVAALAESMLNSLRVGLDQPAREQGDSSVEVARAHREILELLLPDFFGAIQILFRRAVVAGAATDITINSGGEIWSERTLVFVDLVDYSTIAQGADLRDALDQFEIAVASCATDYGGRLVKLLGDGAMLTFTSRAEAISAATSLVRDSSLPPCRAGVATGQVMLRHADFFGPIVNLASRLSTVVEAGEVAVDDSTEVLNADHMAPIHLKGLDTSVTPYRIAQ